MRVISLHTGKTRPMPGTDHESAIDKRAVEGPVRLTEHGLEGDQQCDRRHHGGEMKAICCYPSEHYPRWRETCQRDLRHGSFGENFSTEGWLETEACLGDIVEVAGCRLQVAGPRAPCGTLARFWGRTDFHTIVRKARLSGFYMRVLQGGMMEPGTVTLLERPAPHWSIDAVWRKIDGGAEDSELEELLAMEWLDEDWKVRARKMLGSGVKG